MEKTKTTRQQAKTAEKTSPGSPRTNDLQPGQVTTPAETTQALAPPAAFKPKQKQIGKTKRDLSARAKIVIAELINGATEGNALKAAGYSASYVNGCKTQILSNPVMQKTFIAVLESAGVTDEKIADKVRSLIDAKETKFFSHQGVVTDQKDVEALGIQAEMVQFAAKLKGHVIDRSAALNLNIDLSPVDLDRWENGSVIEVEPVDK